MTKGHDYNSDECRLVEFYRCLTPSQRAEVMENVACKAVDRWLPEFSVYDHMPDAAGVEIERYESRKRPAWPPSGSIAEIIDAGIEATGDAEAYLLTSIDFDEDEAVPWFAGAADAVALRQGSFFNYDEKFAREYLDAWRWEITNAAAQVRDTAARTLEEAAKQVIEVPTDLKEWPRFALTIDGDAISKELDYPPPGDHNVAFELDGDYDVGHARLDLYCKLRFLQRKGREATPEEMAEIANVLDWLRERMQRPSDEGDIQ